ncbi:MAG: threonine aldolase family protein, partial [Actinomycetes bacterium]
LHEGQALTRLHGLVGRPVGDPSRLVSTVDLQDVAEYAAVLLLELPQREIGGQLPSWDELVAQIELARSHGTALHLDGARLLECTPHYGRPPADIAALFDSVYVSLYKGLGGVAGCVLAGEEQLGAEAREWRVRHGGALFGMWPYAAAGLAGLRRRWPRMTAYAEHARAVALELAALDGVELVPDHPPTNMMHLHLRAPAEPLTAAMRRRAEHEDLWTWPKGFPTERPDWQAVELTVGDATLEWTPDEVRELVSTLLHEAAA